MKTMRSYLNEYLRADWDMITGMDISIIRACAEKTNKKKELIEFFWKGRCHAFHQRSEYA